MEIGDFAAKVCSAVQERLGSGYEVESREIRKNNGILMHGLVIAAEKEKVVPVIYLEGFLEAYAAGMPFERVIDRLLSGYGKNMPDETLDVEYFRHFRAVKDRICYRLMGRKRNEDLLHEIPHMGFLDLAICFYYAYHDRKLGRGEILIHNSHMEMWGTDTAELFRLARHNTPELFPWKCQTIEDILKTIGEDAEKSREALDNAAEAEHSRISMKVLTSTVLQFGASCILYPGVLEQIAEKAGQCLYIIPSSLHETILLEDLGSDIRGLKDIISYVNRTQVPPEDVLSDSLYYYDLAEKKVKIL